MKPPNGAAMRSLRRMPSPDGIPMLGSDTTTVKLPAHLDRALTLWARQEGMSRSQAASFLLANALEDMLRSIAVEIACVVSGIAVQRPGVEQM